MEQTDNFYDNQDLAFANDHELTALKKRCVAAESKIKVFQTRFDQEIKTALKAHEEKFQTLLQENRQLKNTVKIHQQALQSREIEITELRKTNKKLRDNYKGIEERMNALRA